MRQEEGEVKPTQVDTQHGRCAVVRVVVEAERIAMVGRKGGGNSPPKPTPGMECSCFLCRRQRGGGSVRLLTKNVPYQGLMVQELKNKQQTRKSGAVKQ